MKTRHIFMLIVTIILIGAVAVGVFQAAISAETLQTVATLENVRAYAPAPTADGQSYAIEGGKLFAGVPLHWTEVKIPQNVVASAVAIDSRQPNIIYMGAANELALYRSEDTGKSWLRIPLASKTVGGVTAIAVDSFQRLVFVGTDTAGLFRLRDVGSSMILSGQLLLDEPVRQVVTDNTGVGMAFVRTDWRLYRAENYGLSWSPVDNLLSNPTSVAIADTQPATVYVGTTDRGLLESTDGLTWKLANTGLGFVPGSRLHVDALAVDPAQPQVVYVATSYLYGSTAVHTLPRGIAMSTDQAQSWASLVDKRDVSVVDLLPIPGQTGSIYGVTDTSRNMLALGNAPVAVAQAAVTPATSGATTPLASLPAILAWIIAGLAALALGFAIVTDLRGRRLAEAPGSLETQPVHNKR